MILRNVACAKNKNIGGLLSKCRYGFQNQYSISNHLGPADLMHFELFSMHCHYLITRNTIIGTWDMLYYNMRMSNNNDATVSK